jgi:transcriptional regulator with XRE-family HTH domain
MSGTATVIIAQLAIAREDAALSLHEVARRAGRGHTQIRTWELGKTQPSIDGLVDWADALGYDVALLRRFTEPEPTEEATL